ncbi:MAG: aminotransferase class III-fold pyridoxal phosphate-dependent enzyme, partial [Candidatus Omnitrophica bacterium]|nr:aminotransferase class III-fold pyridoxal phosphate-dependent enzyme [Candidatus Omnitrophota bacterium]
MPLSVKAKKVLNIYDKYVMATYTRVPIVLTKGSGCRVWDIDGKEYLDFFPGWAVSGLGHCHTNIVRAIRRQANKII